MSQTETRLDEEYVRGWIEAFPLGEELQERGRQLRESLPLKVIMVTFGTGFNRDTNGIQHMRNMILYDPIVAANHSEQIHVTSLSDKISLYTNRLDIIFNSYYRQGLRGKNVQGQANFLRIYDRQMGTTKLYKVFKKLWYRILDGIEDYAFHGLPFCHFLSCEHGHHRSQAVACLMQKLIWHYWEFVEAKVFHVDDRYHEETLAMLRNQALRSQFVGGIRNACSPPVYYVPMHRKATPEDMEK